MRKQIANLVILLVSALPYMSVAQNAPSAFEVASIKPSPSSVRGATTMMWPPGRFMATNVSVSDLVAFAYSAANRPPLLKEQIIGGPSWTETDRFEIQARREGESNRETTQVMVRSLLADRFQLKTHDETRESPVFNLTVLKDGLKMKTSADQGAANRQAAPPAAAGQGQRRGAPNLAPARGAYGTMSTSEGTTLKGNAVPISVLVDMLHGPAGRAVVDKTGLSGLFDFELKFTSVAPAPAQDPAAGALGPSLFTAIQEQLGLKLESARGPGRFLVIDRVERPTED